MTLTAAMEAARSSLLAVETQMSVTSSNISNANVKGYTKESVAVTTNASNGFGSGVVTQGIIDQVSQYLERNIVKANSDSAYASTVNSYMDTLQSSLGSITSSSTSKSTDDLSTYLSSLSADLTQLSATPEDAALRTSVVNDLNSATASLRTAAAQVQSLTTQINSDINSSVTDANTALANIASLNTQIVTLRAQGQSTVALEDKQRLELSTVSNDLNISYFVNSAGMMQVTTATGQSLVTSGVVNNISYTGTNITVGGTVVTSSVTSGSIGALLSMKNTQLPNIGTELDTLATSIMSSLNAVHNPGTGNPAADTLNGSTQATGFSAGSTGQAMINVAVVGSDGKAIANSQVVDLSGVSTLSGVASAIQTALQNEQTSAGLSATATASINASGQLVISTGSSSYGVAISTVAGSSFSVTGVPATSASSTTINSSDFSTAFGLNDLLTGTANAGTGLVSAASLRVRSDILAAPTAMAVGSMSSSGVTTGNSAVSAGDTTIAAALQTTLSTSQTFPANGNLGAATTTFGGYAAMIIGDVALRSSNAETTASAAASSLTTLQDSFSSQSGVNVTEETANLVSLQNAYAASAKVLTTIQSMFNDLLDAVK